MEAAPNLLNLMEHMRAYADLLLSEGVEPREYLTYQEVLLAETKR